MLMIASLAAEAQVAGRGKRGQQMRHLAADGRVMIDRVIDEMDEQRRRALLIEARSLAGLGHAVAVEADEQDHPFPADEGDGASHRVGCA